MITIFEHNRTAAKLMNMTDKEMADIQPDMTVYDKFHRAGAAL